MEFDTPVLEDDQKKKRKENISFVSLRCPRPQVKKQHSSNREVCDCLITGFPFLRSFTLLDLCVGISAEHFLLYWEADAVKVAAVHRLQMNAVPTDKVNWPASWHGVIEIMACEWAMENRWGKCHLS